jgi:hypothetical protein
MALTRPQSADSDQARRIRCGGPGSESFPDCESVQLLCGNGNWFAFAAQIGDDRAMHSPINRLHAAFASDPMDELRLETPFAIVDGVDPLERQRWLGPIIG